MCIQLTWWYYSSTIPEKNGLLNAANVPVITSCIHRFSTLLANSQNGNGKIDGPEHRWDPHRGKYCQALTAAPPFVARRILGIIARAGVHNADYDALVGNARILAVDCVIIAVIESHWHALQLIAAPVNVKAYKLGIIFSRCFILAFSEVCNRLKITSK